MAYIPYSKEQKIAYSKQFSPERRESFRAGEKYGHQKGWYQAIDILKRLNPNLVLPGGKIHHKVGLATHNITEKDIDSLFFDLDKDKLE